MKRLLKTARWVVLVGFALAAMIVLYFAFTLPRIPADLNEIALSTPTKIYADDGTLVRTLADREVVPLEQVSQDLIHAILSLEDAGFYRHHGISKKGLVRAFFSNLLAFRVREGGSTITQQLAKNLFFSFDRSVLRKMKEALTAVQMERQFSKETILEAYVNQINFGSGLYGVEMAAQNYFSKHADELSLSESAMLAGIPRWPARYSPYSNESVAGERQAFVLKRMFNHGYISEAEYETANDDSLIYSRINRLSGSADYYIADVLKRAGEKYGKEAVYYGGLEIVTGMNARYQFEANRAITEGLQEFDDLLGLSAYSEASWQEKLNYPQAALVAVDVQTGAVRALVGGRDFRRAPFNRAVSNNRHAGSAFKPFTYFCALDRGVVTPITVMVDKPVEFRYDNQVWNPENFDKIFRGPIVIKAALMHSINTIAAQLIDRVKPSSVIRYAHSFGIESPMEEHYTLSLGATGVSALEMASAYATIASQGIRHEPYSVKSISLPSGREIERWETVSRRVFDPQTCYILIDMMKGVVEEGTARSVRARGFRRPCAGKTGTTSSHRDAWFVGYTPGIVAAVWIGFDDNRIMTNKWGRGVTGASAAIPIWVRFMSSILTDRRYTDFAKPPGIDFIQIDPRTGAGPMPGGPRLPVAVRAKGSER